MIRGHKNNKNLNLKYLNIKKLLKLYLKQRLYFQKTYKHKMVNPHLFKEPTNYLKMHKLVN